MVYLQNFVERLLGSVEVVWEEEHIRQHSGLEVEVMRENGDFEISKSVWLGQENHQRSEAPV